MSEGTLNAFISALRCNAPNEDQLIASEAQRIRHALQGGSKSDKAEAVLKVAYLRMLGLDCSEWAAAGMLEVMSFATQALWRPGFLASSMCFNDKTPVVLLAVNVLRKRMLNAADVAGVCAALTTASTISTPEIASALHLDVVTLLQSTKPHVRNRACVCILAFIKVSPAVLLVAYPHLKELLIDPDAAVKATACSALLEVVSKQPHNYTNLAPLVYTMLETGKPSSYCAVKGLILLRLLCPYEPRLGPKLVPLLTQLLQQEGLAMSLLHEIARLVIECLPANLDLSHSCMQIVKDRFIVPDYNLKAAGLQLLARALDQENRGWPEKIKTMLDQEIMKEIAPLVQSPHALMRGACLQLLKHSVTKSSFPAIFKVLLDVLEGDREELQPETASDFLETLLSLAETKSFGLIDDMKGYASILLKISLRPDLQGNGLAAVQNHIVKLADDPDCGAIILRAMVLHLASSNKTSLLKFTLKFYLERLQQAVDTVVPDSTDVAALESLAKHAVQDERKSAALAAAISLPAGGSSGGFITLLGTVLQEIIAKPELPCVNRGLAVVALARLAAIAQREAVVDAYQQAVQITPQMLNNRYAAIRLSGRTLSVAFSLKGSSPAPAPPTPLVIDDTLLDEPFGEIVPALMKPKKKKKKRGEESKKTHADEVPSALNHSAPIFAPPKATADTLDLLS